MSPQIDYLQPNAPGMHAVSPKLAYVRLVSPLIGLLLGLVLCWWLDLRLWLWLTVIGLSVWGMWVGVRSATAIRWVETDTDLVVRKGRMWRRATIVPYGRIQFVRLSQGPVARFAGLTTAHINTASASSDCSIPGLPQEVAVALRERLSGQAKERMAGL